MENTTTVMENTTTVMENTKTCGHVLGMVNYGPAYNAPTSAEGVPLLSLQMVADETDSFIEVWRTANPPHVGCSGNLHYAHDGEYLFCAAEIPRSESYRDVTRTTYLAAFELIEQLGYPQIFRMWNFIPDINEDNLDGLEIYRDFCAGRSEAFEQYNAQRPMHMPAATGIGTQGGNIAFYFLACRSAKSVHLENPRQMPAYTYPEKYGPRSPSFARATSILHGAAGSLQLYISGTASIIGHETVHLGDIAKQCDVTLDNISFLIGKDNLMAHGIKIHTDLTLKDVDFIKVYVRNAEHIPIVQRKCHDVFSRNAKIQYFNVDICRSDLLVEIEGIVSIAMTEREAQQDSKLHSYWLG